MERLELEEKLFLSLLSKNMEIEVALQNLRLTEQVATFVEMVVACFKRGGKLIVFGNGGSASDASHFCAEFAGRFKKDRKPYPAICINDAAYLTAVANDYGYNRVFSRAVLALAKSEDLVIGISTSGNSVNFRLGILLAGDLAIRSVGLVGLSPDLVDAPFPNLLVETRTTNTAITQELHMSILHTVVEMVEIEMGDVDA
jgi:D-sedoheptulose 7-phosphate isomerase